MAAGWGSPSLRAVADDIVEGNGPAALAPYLRRVIACGQLPVVKKARRRLLLGHTDDGTPFSLGVRGRNVLVAGDAQSGKSWVQYTRAVLPALARLRRRTGLPHRIILDEAHYFLDGSPARELFDLRGNGYTLATYRASHPPKAVLDASEVSVVTCGSDPPKSKPSTGYAARRSPWTPGARCSLAWASARPRIAITEETGASLRRIHLGLRITHHASNGVRAATLKEFAEARDRLPAEVVEGHAPRGDFSRWIREVFGDYQLALEVHALETRSREESDAGAVAAIGSVIRGRYDLAADDEMHGGAANA